MKYVILLFLLVGCSSKVVKVEKAKSWTERKRECHTFYLDKFGLSKEDAIGICKEELGRSNR